MISRKSILPWLEAGRTYHLDFERTRCSAVDEEGAQSSEAGE